MSDSKLYFGGMPTGPDVARLMEEIPPESMEPGTTYSHEDVAGIVGAKHGTNRYRTVTTAWRRELLRDHNVDTVVDPSIGIRVLHDHERLSVGLSDAKRARRATQRAATRIDRADRDNLTEHQRAQADHAVKLLAATAHGMRSDERKIASAGRVVSLPRPERKAKNET